MTVQGARRCRGKSRGRGIYQRLLSAYREPDRGISKEMMHAVIASGKNGIPAGLKEVITLERTLNRRAIDILAYFERPGTSNSRAEDINARLEHLRGCCWSWGSATSPTTSPDRC